ncbi:hypothetical protein MSG28_006591 [Choristoneura fumiferana]|uniref:Uncharacterized protein n=1 Tax=Choristoneura fumiferana TaxID=7141 RepID=A0ACC0JFK9_CHOFU|nr:hypothetical protein MSG28_006591 [Choristoneura fumiferana]
MDRKSARRAADVLQLGVTQNDGETRANLNISDVFEYGAQFAQLAPMSPLTFSIGICLALPFSNYVQPQRVGSFGLSPKRGIPNKNHTTLPSRHLCGRHGNANISPRRRRPVWDALGQGDMCNAGPGFLALARCAATPYKLPSLTCQCLAYNGRCTPDACALVTRITLPSYAKGHPAPDQHRLVVRRPLVVDRWFMGGRRVDNEWTSRGLLRRVGDERRIASVRAAGYHQVVHSPSARGNLAIEAISIADPSFGVSVVEEMYRPPPAPAPVPSGALDRPYVRILEQPAGKSLRGTNLCPKSFDPVILGDDRLKVKFITDKTTNATELPAEQLFRYECEGRSAGSIPGASSTPERKTYPTIEVCGYKGRFVVLVSCVTKDRPYRWTDNQGVPFMESQGKVREAQVGQGKSGICGGHPDNLVKAAGSRWMQAASNRSNWRPHPHNLVGREPACSRGVCTVEMNGDSSTVQFSNLGIQCVKRKDIAEALRAREEMKVDPFKKISCLAQQNSGTNYFLRYSRTDMTFKLSRKERTYLKGRQRTCDSSGVAAGFGHKTQPQQIDLNAVRLCFQVYIPGEKTSKIKQALHPVVSDVIYDKKAMCELQINRISTCAGSVKGGTELILLCEKVGYGLCLGAKRDEQRT